MKHASLIVLPVLAITMATPGCKAVNNVARSISKASESVGKLAQNLSTSITSMKKNATKATTGSPASKGGVPAFPKKVTGNVDIKTSAAGKSGTGTVDVNGDGTEEDALIYVLAAAAAETEDSGTSETNSLRILAAGDESETAFLSWKGDEAGGDSGKCYLAWEHNSTAWFVISNCDSSDHAHVCSAEGDTISCSACNESGTCTECDEDQSLDECTVKDGAEGSDDTAKGTDDTSK